MVWLVLRRQEISEPAYLRNVANYFGEFTDMMGGCYGHYARVGEDHILHFLQCEPSVDTKALGRWIKEIVDSRDDKFILYDLTEALPLPPFGKGWGSSFTFGKAVNVQFF